MVRFTDGVDSTNPLPDPGNIAASTFADSGTDVRIAFDEARDPSPELLAALPLKLESEDIVTKLSNGDVSLLGFAASVKCGLCGQTIEGCRDELGHPSNVGAAGKYTRAGIPKQTKD